jgi:hypothetical protein
MSKTEIMISIFLNNTDKVTVGDVRQWLEKVDQFNIADDTQVSDAILSVDLFIRPEQMSLIQCGEHLVGDEHHDIIINTHTCINAFKE